MYNYAIKHEIVEKNYSSFLDFPKLERKNKKIPFSKDEIELLWRNKNKPFVNVILVQLYTGTRIGELLDLTLDNIHLKERYFFIDKSKTAAGIRKVPIHKDIECFFNDALKNNNKYLFENNKKHLKYRNYLVTIYEPLMLELNLKHTTHEARHTFISQCDRLNLNKVSIARIVGHKSKNITEHYTHKDMNDLLDAMDQFRY